VTNVVQARPAPYPADTRAKGWRFELDYEKIDQSDTWDLASEIPLSQHCLLMMWLVAWRQEPCGSFPNDEAVIRAKCKIPADTWSSVRQVLMRGWWLADDGRLYHDTIVQRVKEMLAKRRKEADRKAAYRAQVPEEPAGGHMDVPDMSRGTEKGLHPESDTSTRTSINTSEEDKSSSSVGRAKRSTGRSSTRIPDDWKPSEQDFAYAESKGWTRVRAMVEAESFKNHYLAADGKNAKSPDWPAKWRTWVLNGTKWEAENRGHARSPPKAAQSRHSGFQQMDYLEGVTSDGRLK
jgi:uncharacterized protein YdaU (DUF1376 family)